MPKLPNLTTIDWFHFKLWRDSHLQFQPLGSELNRIFIANRKLHGLQEALTATEADAKVALARKQKKRLRAVFSRIFSKR